MVGVVVCLRGHGTCCTVATRLQQHPSKQWLGSQAHNSSKEQQHRQLLLLLLLVVVVILGQQSPALQVVCYWLP